MRCSLGKSTRRSTGGEPLIGRVKPNGSLALMLSRQCAQTPRETWPVSAHRGEQLAVGHLIDRHPYNLHALIIVRLGVHLVSRLLEREHRGIAPRAMILAIRADHFDVFGRDVRFLERFAQRALDGVLTVGDGAAGNPPCAAFRAPRPLPNFLIPVDKWTGSSQRLNCKAMEIGCSLGTAIFLSGSGDTFF